MNPSNRSLTLADLLEGQQAVVHTLNSHGSLRRRLRDLGLIEGTPVRCLHISPLGDPVAYGIRGSVVALRRSDAGQVFVEGDPR